MQMQRTNNEQKSYIIAPVAALEGVSAGYDGKAVLSDIHLRLNPGAFVYLTGRTGSGKTTLLKVLYGALRPLSGRAMVAGYDLTDLGFESRPLLRRQLGMIFQDFRLLRDRSVFDNLDFVLRATGWVRRKARADRISFLLDRVGLSAKKDEMPERLSGGEQQKAVIARALLNSPVLILADEPTAQLDPATSVEILQLLVDVAREQRAAVLFATHDRYLMEEYDAPVFEIASHT